VSSRGNRDFYSGDGSAYPASFFRLLPIFGDWFGTYGLNLV